MWPGHTTCDRVECATEESVSRQEKRKTPFSLSTRTIPFLSRGDGDGGSKDTELCCSCSPPLSIGNKVPHITARGHHTIRSPFFPATSLQTKPG